MSADEAPRQGEADAESRESHGFKDKMKDAWQKLNPISPRAKTDLTIMRSWSNADNRAEADVKDSLAHPEIHMVAEVRRGNDLCPEEAQFLAKRKERIRENFAQYLNLDLTDVHLEDVPIVALGGSGGGFRAMLGLLAYSAEMKKSGLWDLLAYISGVSGSCWSIAAYYTFGGQDMDAVIQHCKQRFGLHPLSDDAIRAVLSAPGGADMAFGPLETKTIAGLHVVPMDYYSVLTSGHIFLHHREQRPADTEDPEFTGFSAEWFKFTNVQKVVADGAEPLPIMTAVRHERPWKDWVDKDHPFADHDYDQKEHAEMDAWFQWFEMTPFEVGCDELEAWVPTWGFGRPFEAGKSTMQLPEHSLALLLGLCTSAPAGSMDSYIATIKRNLPATFIGNQVKHLAKRVANLWGEHGTSVFEGHHPLHACNEHNFVFHLNKERPPGLENSPRIHLIDSGMDNNCPTYVMLHPSREVDIVINMDASSDVVKDQQARIDQIGGRRGLKFSKRHDVKPTEGFDKYAGMYGQIYDGLVSERPGTVVDSYGKTVPTPPAPVCHQPCTMVYMPLLPNERAVEGFDPTTAKFSSSYNLVWTPEEVEILVKVCIGNFRQAEPIIKEVLRETYERKKAARLAA